MIYFALAILCFITVGYYLGMSNKRKEDEDESNRPEHKQEKK